MEVLHRLDLWARHPEDVEVAPIVVSSRSALALRLPSRERLRRATQRIRVGETLDRDLLAARLVSVGYQRMALVEEPGEVAVRGDIIDVFPPGLPQPLRIELWGEEVDSIRSFDPASQRSQQKSATALLPPPRELLFERDEIIERDAAIRAAAEAQSIPSVEVDPLIDSLLRGHVPPGAESLAPLIQPDQESFVDYLPSDTLVLIEEPEEGATRFEQVYDEVLSGHASALGERLTVDPEHLLRSPDQLTRDLEALGAISLERLDLVDAAGESGRHLVDTQSHEELRRTLVGTRSHDRALAPLVDQCREWLGERWRVVIAASSLSSAERLKSLLDEYDLEAHVATDPRPVWHWSLPGRLEIRVIELHEGFVWPEQGLVVLTDEEIFGVRQRKRARQGWREGQKLEGIAQLAPGDFLVHADHGIGIYRGLVELAAGGLSSELLAIEYLGQDKLFLPVDRLSRVQRFGAGRRRQAAHRQTRRRDLGEDQEQGQGEPAQHGG